MEILFDGVLNDFEYEENTRIHTTFPINMDALEV